MGKKHSKLTALERERISNLLVTGVSLQAIARKLGRSDSTIRDEIRRNRFGKQYVAIHAQAKAQQRAVKARARHPHWHLHHETIYRFIYAKENKDKQLFEYFPRKQKKRKEKHGRKCHRSRIPDRVSIQDRPETVESRQEFGHWEGAKKTDLTKVTQAEHDAIIEEINNRPRKCLGFRTPREAFEQELHTIGARIPA